jgi:hypothetical protein
VAVGPKSVQPDHGGGGVAAGFNLHSINRHG